MNKNVKITVKVDINSFTSIASFNFKNNLDRIDLNHLPFRNFTCSVNQNVKADVDDKEFLDNLEDITRGMNITGEKKEKIIKTYIDKCRDKTQDIVMDFILTISTNSIRILVDDMIDIVLEVKNGILNTNEQMLKDINDFKFTILSPRLESLVNSSKIEKERFDSFCFDSIGNMLHLLMYMSADSKVEITKDELFESKEFYEKKQPKKNKNGKKKKSSVSVIKVIECNIPKSIVLNNIKNNTPRRYERQTEQWFTKGFWRTYKSGKAVWIEPGIRKARNSSINKGNKNIEKTYVVK